MPKIVFTENTSTLRCRIYLCVGQSNISDLVQLVQELEFVEIAV